MNDILPKKSQSEASMRSLNNKKIAQELDKWYNLQARDLPWRESKSPDPYKVWISEIMLQQTTTKVVAGYFKRFTTKWPTVNKLAKAEIEDVYEMWQGLGYYSRARNILKTAKIVSADYKGKFPYSYKELMDLPGIGPYTSRAISSICFNEKVGVVDGNVLRVHNRLIGEKVEWWNKDFHNLTQVFSDELCKYENPSHMNQALMDLGATVCTPKKVACLVCPLKKLCNSYKAQNQNEIPLPKPRKESQTWVYQVLKKPKTTQSKKRNTGYILASNETGSPILKGKPLPAGKFKKTKVKPKTYSFMHTITKHKIYVQFIDHPKDTKNLKEYKIADLRRENPSSLIEKIWQHPDFNGKL